MDTQEPTLRHGDEGIDGWVEYLQGLLINEGYTNVTKNGSFDDATLEAVQQYQLHNGLVTDGTVGNQTWASLRHGDAQMAGTDGRQPGTYVEDRREARWVYDEETVHHDPAARRGPARGRRATTRVPPPGRGSTRHSPPSSAARSCIDTSPTPGRGAFGSPRPSSSTTTVRSSPPTRRNEHVAAPAWRTAFVIASVPIR